MKDLKAEATLYPNALVDVIPAEFYSDQDAAQAISMAEAAIEGVRQWLEG